MYVSEILCKLLCTEGIDLEINKRRIYIAALMGPSENRGSLP
jgi:hypothetical protein